MTYAAQYLHTRVKGHPETVNAAEIKRMYFERGMTQRAIGRLYGITQSRVCRIVNQRPDTWQRVRMAIENVARKYEDTGH